MRHDHSFRAFVTVLIALGLAALSLTAQVRTPKQAVSDEYHGVKVIEDYQWLENASDPKVKKWTADQNDYARSYLDKLSTRPALAYELQKLYSTVSADYSSLKVVAGKTFALKFKPPAQQPILISLRSPNDPKSETVVLDPTRLDPQGGTSIDWYEPSLDANYVAVCLSEHGSEAGTLYVYEASTGKRLSDAVPRVQFPTGGGSVSWNKEGFFYTRYPAPGHAGGAGPV
jgi:prolyl oligopeptidase